MFLFRSVFHPELIFSSTCLCLTAHPFTCLFADFLCLPACRTVSVCLPARLTVSVSPHTRLSAYMSHCLCLPACLPVCLSACLPPDNLSSCLPTCFPTVCLSARVFVCLSYCLPANVITLVPLASLPVMPSA